ncbi:hypothetical protein HQQ80_01690 [Microbacteriaceae bacterium VKM Ac-2855]|nr:hypothetical protein [Microbacteriaceae bacterium VKM Ac-2855]
MSEIDDPARTISALRALGLVGRAEFTAENQSILTYLREDGDLLHLFAYHFLYETRPGTTVDIVLPGSGTVHRIDPNTGTSALHRGVRTGDQRTVVTVTLAPGESALFTIDRSSPALESAPFEVTTLAELTRWGIAVESWDAGEDEIIIEDRGLGYETREIRPTTVVTRLESSDTDLRSWKDLAGVGPEVSGVGEYRARFELLLTEKPAGAIILDLGTTSGGLGSVSINGGVLHGFDTSRPVIDITSEVREGENEVVVRVSSSLNNRLLARGYYEDIPDMTLSLAGRNGTHQTSVRDHGLLGPVTIQHLA